MALQLWIHADALIILQVPNNWILQNMDLALRFLAPDEIIRFCL